MTSSRLTALLAVLVGLLAAPALAECPDAMIDMRTAQPALARVMADLSRRYQFPWGGAHVWGQAKGDKIAMSLAFDRLTGKNKRVAIDMLQLGGLPATLYKPSQFDTLTAATPMSPYSVYAHDGRLLSLPYDGCTRLYFFTEYDRLRMRWQNRQAPPRVMRYPLPEATNKYVTDTFWSIVTRKQPDVLHMTWVPEAGHFEIVVAMEARWRYRNRLAPFWWYAPLDLHYVVLDADGEWLEERGLAPAPWIWGS